jgi:hypothetical protein
MSDSSKTYVAVSGKPEDIGFLAGVLRAQKIPFRQALTYGRAPVLKIPAAYTAPLQAILDNHRAQHPTYFVSAAELKKAQDIFWIMLLTAAGILSIAWGRYFIRRFF